MGRAARALATTPDVQPIVIGAFTLHATGLDVHGRPGFEEYAGVGDFIDRAHKASGWWVADWLRYGATRPEWRQRLEQLLELTGYAHGTALNYKFLGENVPPSRRRKDVDISLHMEVASLHPKEQDELLEKAATERMTKRQLRREVQARKRNKVLEGQATEMHTVDVTVEVLVEAKNDVLAGDLARAHVKRAIEQAPRDAALTRLRVIETVVRGRQTA